jgi:hypothetical protein
MLPIVGLQSTKQKKAQHENGAARIRSDFGNKPESNKGRLCYNCAVPSKMCGKHCRYA